MDRLPLDAFPEVIPPEVATFLEDAERRIEDFNERHGEEIVPGFIASNPYYAYAALQQLTAQHPAGGRTFCEWGSGFGVIACLARLLGFRASGIEIEPLLIAEARKLAADHHLDIRFYEGSYKPEGFYTDEIDPARLSQPLGVSPLEFDLIYVYPWPAEYDRVMDMLHRFAAPGTEVLLFRGGGKLEYWRQPDADAA